MFRVEDRDRARDFVLRLASSDARVVAGAAVGSLALGPGDRWSDLDLTFAVAEEFSIFDVLEDWTRTILRELAAAHLFDLPSGPSIYRVFLLPGCLQFDLSFTPASAFGATGPRFKLLFGVSVDRPHVQPAAAREFFGHGVHHALRARVCLERERRWQAEYWISSARGCAQSLACLRRGLPALHGRGLDDLPDNVLALFAASFATSLERSELLRALGVVVQGLVREAGDAAELAATVEAQLQDLIAPDL
jgi:hypothetical protein